MLVMTRKVGERIVIGDNVTVTVVLIGGGFVRVGIEAPPEYPIVRRELVDRGSPAQKSSANRVSPPRLEIDAKDPP